MRIADLLCDVGKAQKSMIEFMESNKERFGLKDQDIMNIFPLERQKIVEELEDIKGTPYECGKQSYKHLL
ncbi:hypothetical protein QZJ98_18495 [Acinetobacter baumannii]|nr:hypothetical protein [Acinetobacter baumannii]MDN8340208.1 hypothetical protein [Acinetobacter baumannii]